MANEVLDCLYELGLTGSAFSEAMLGMLKYALGVYAFLYGACDDVL